MCLLKVKRTEGFPPDNPESCLFIDVEIASKTATLHTAPHFISWRLKSRLTLVIGQLIEYGRNHILGLPREGQENSQRLLESL